MSSDLLRWTIAASIALHKLCTFLFVDVKAIYCSVLHSVLDPHSFNEATLEEVLNDADFPLAFYRPI